MTHKILLATPVGAFTLALIPMMTEAAPAWLDQIAQLARDHHAEARGQGAGL